MDFFIDRFSYASTETEGVLSIHDFTLATIERPWIAASRPGGKSFESCIPDGIYTVEPFDRPSGEKAYILSNPELGVFKFEGEGDGRYLCLLHIANFARNVVGCIGPGMRRAIMMDKKVGAWSRAVSDSGEAMRILNSKLGRTGKHRLIIRSKSGTN